MLLSMWAGTAMADTPPVVAEIKPLKVTVSSHLPPWKGFTFDAKNLHDGRVDTSWQPAKSDMLGVGQWVEVDLGGYYAIDRVEIAQGLQLMHPTLGDLFCRNNRMDYGTLVFDDGSTTDISARGGELTISVSDLYGYNGDDAVYKRTTKTVARKLLLIIRGVFMAVDWSDLAIAEIRVFGVPAAPHPSPEDRMRCNRPGAFELKSAIFDYCSKLNARQFSSARCEYIGPGLANCVTKIGPGWMAPTGRLAMPSPIEIAKGDVTVEMRVIRERHQFRLARKGADRWVVKEHILTDEAGTVVPPGNKPYTLYYDDSQLNNPCWDRLGKTKPVFEEGHSCDNSDASHDDEDDAGEADGAAPTDDKAPKP